MTAATWRGSTRRLMRLSMRSRSRPMALRKDRVEDIVRRHTPTDWTVIESGAHTKSKSGECNFEAETIRVPKLEDAQSVYIFLHECQHVHLGHYRLERIGHVQEYEAERRALALALIEGNR